MPLLPGDRAPYFNTASTVNPSFNFDTVAGRYVVLCFFGSTQNAASRAFLDQIVRRGNRFDVTNLIFFGVTNDPEDAKTIQQADNGQIYFFDFDFSITRKYGVLGESITDDNSSAVTALTPTTFVLDQSLRVVGIFQFGDEPVVAAERMFSFLDSLPAFNALTHVAPVLIVPYVLEPELCTALITYYESKGGQDSGFMRDVNGRTTGLIDYSHKRRLDCEITDEPLIRAIHSRLRRRLIPAIQQAYQFNVSRIERNILACYDAAQGAHFKAHRDNTTIGTAHRRFAVTINLNASDYEGAEIRFPEFGPKLFKAPSGAAIVFSCSLLHEVPKVTKGKRYAYLPFLYDESAAALRERNRNYVACQAAGDGQTKSQTCLGAPTTGPHAISDAGARTSPAATGANLPVIDGSCGCGNRDGCRTCLTAATYQIANNPRQH